MSLSLLIRKFVLFKKADQKDLSVISWDDETEITHMEKMREQGIDFKDIVCMGYARYSTQKSQWIIEERFSCFSDLEPDAERDGVLLKHLEKISVSTTDSFFLKSFQKGRD